MIKLKSLKAFTLAEILVVVAIIGMIADMTIPTLVAGYQAQVRVTRLKKIYSTLSSAYSLMLTEYGDPKL